MEICPSRSVVRHLSPFPLQFLLNVSTTFKQKRRKETESFQEAAAAAAAACSSARTCWPARFYLPLPCEHQAALPPEISSCAFSQSTNWRDNNLLCVIHVRPEAGHMPKPVPASCVIKRVIVFRKWGRDFANRFQIPTCQQTEWNDSCIWFYCFLHSFFAFHCVSAAQPAAVQQLQGLHEA